MTRQKDNQKDPCGWEDDDYYVKRMDPVRADYVQIGYCLFNGLKSQPFFQQLLGPDYMPASVSCIADPRERIHRSIREAEKYNASVLAFGRSTHGLMLDSHYVAWGLYHRCSTHDELVGFTLWRLPSPMEKALNEPICSITRRFMFTLWKYIVRYKYKLQDALARWKFGYDAFHNGNLDELNEHCSITFTDPPFMTNSSVYRDFLAKLTYEELMNEPYCPKDAILVASFCILPEYKRRGLGSLLLNHCLDHVPVKPVRIVSKDGQHETEGPQKITLVATEEGAPFYERNRFTETFVHDFTTSGGRRIVETRMDMTRL